MSPSVMTDYDDDDDDDDDHDPDIYDDGDYCEFNNR